MNIPRNVSVVCPTCGTESGPADGDPCQVIEAICDECAEIESCPDCNLDKVIETDIRVAQEDRLANEI